MKDRSLRGASRLERKVLNASDMSLQVCNCCGWSKSTTYHGLRTHQGKMGCTPRGMSIPESDQFRFNSYIPTLTFMEPPIKVEDPLMNIVTSSYKSDFSSDMSLQVCHCGWSKMTSYHGLRTHQGTMGCTPKGMRIQESEQYRWGNHWEGSPPKDSGPFNWITPVKKEVTFSNLTTPKMSADTETALKMLKSMMENEQQSLQTVTYSDQTHRALDFASGAQVQPLLMPVSKILSTQANPTAAEVTAKQTNKSLFETPQHFSTTHQTTTNARRALDFSTSAQQVGQLVWGLPTTTVQETAVPPNDTEKEKEREKEREIEREAQKLQKARQDRMRADLQLEIQTREQKMAEVTSCVKTCKGSLDAEWLEINNVFSEVMRVVEDTRQKALQPLEKRRKRVKREAQDLVQKLQNEIDKLKKTIDELDKKPDLQVSPDLNKYRDWKNVTVDTSFCFGSLRTTTSNMMEEIHRKLEKLSSVELKRIPTFAVDVKLDPASAHRCLVLSPDLKTVRDGGKNQIVPDTPQRFDTFGSILGLNRLNSGKSYWEVEVSNKTGWDLGLARRDANRTGKLSLKPDNGYWVTVHYEDKKYAALTEPPTSLSLTEKPQKVGVFVDYDEGLVSFYDVTARSHIYSFTECSFSGEISPYFSPHLKQNEKNSHPLIISPVRKQ
ncbi:E3 ubiquitin-protein ligase TRIM21-like isoform X1 [Perca fluviatilis]|uniref:E3 ubiquitin-protein ligase TRIM21-like isoform X1 n=2 Tax=Perca fluviatilis TaxID=8168 RepID=UPI001965308F|nr:E3 ubiquitin-protein ligase TRIM21-like isoform X1 [Perca fluviatilis]